MSVRYYCDVCETEQLFNQTAPVAIQIGTASPLEPQSQPLPKLEHVCFDCRVNIRTAVYRLVDAKSKLS